MAKLLKGIFNISFYYYFILLLGLIFLTISIWIKNNQALKINERMIREELVLEDSYEELSLYSAAYLLGKQGEYDNAIEKFTLILKLFPDTKEMSDIYFNIGTLYLKDALTKPLNDDGKVTAENFQKLQSAIIALEKSLILNPDNTKAKFNLSLLFSSIPAEPSSIISEQSVQELSNIPIGLP